MATGGDEFDVEEPLAQLGFSQRGRIAVEVIVDQAQLTIIGMAGAIGVVTQRQQVSEPGHRVVRMAVIDRVDILTTGGADEGEMILSVHTPPA